MLVVVCFGMFFVTLSFAEMVSMYVWKVQSSIRTSLTYVFRAPTAGGQYHWVSELAPVKHQRFLSYVVGMSLYICS